jgi:hypothetical protein
VISLNGQDVLFALKENAIHRCSKPEDPSTESNPHQFGQAAFLSEVAHFPAVEAWKVAGGKQLWWPDGSLLWWWGRGTIELLLRLLLLLELSRLKLWAMAPVLLLLWSMQLTPRWGIHHMVLRRSTVRITTACRSRHQLLPLFLIGLSNGLHHPLLVNGRTCQLVVRQVREMHQALLQVDGEPCVVQVGLLLIRVDVVCAILSQSVELPCVVEYTTVPLLEV